MESATESARAGRSSGGIKTTSGAAGSYIASRRPARAAGTDVRVEDQLNWAHPDYSDVLRARAARLAKLRADPMRLALARAHYRDHPDDFINDWGMTVDPRAVERGLPAIMPFVLFPKQRELIRWIVDGWRKSEGGILEKSRDMGASWLAVSTAATLCLFHKGVVIGFGSRKEELVDSSADPDALFWKAREFLKYLPPEFRGGWDARKHSTHRRIQFPYTNSMMKGEAGDNIGRGGRTSIYFVDEAAYLERPKLIDASLSATTNCRVDMSSVNGMANSFAERRHKAGARVFTFHYSNDPRKDEAWKRSKLEGPNALDSVVWAAEYEINYTASVEGIIIPALWVAAAIDAHVKLGLKASGAKRGALDVADGGVDKNAFGVAEGVVQTHAESWRGSPDLDIFHTVERAFMLSDTHGLDGFIYDADGLGAGVRGDARKVNEARTEAAAKGKKAPTKIVEPHRGSGAVFQPEQIVPGTERKAGDYFENFKAQAWHAAKERFKLTYRAITGTVTDYNPSNIISLSSTIPELGQLKLELSQPTWVPSKSGKWMVEKAPDGTLSPNLADTTIMLFAPRRGPMVIDPSAFELFGKRS